MKQDLFATFVVLLFSVFLVACTELEHEKELALRDWEPVSKNVINNYFHKFNHPSLQSCEQNTEKIMEIEEDFQLERYGRNYKVLDVDVDYDYQWKHEGDYLHVDVICDYQVYFMIPPFYSGNDELRIYEGTYRMKKYYNQETKRLISLAFE